MRMSRVFQARSTRQYRAVGILLLLVVTVSLSYGQTKRESTLAPTAPVSAGITEQNQPVTHSDLYCSGFMVPKSLPLDGFVEGGQDTPLQSRFVTNDFIFLRGFGYQPGTRVSIVRAVHDPDRFTPFPGETKLRRDAGQLYADLGYAVIVENRGTETAVAKIEFACDSIAPGDQVVPFHPRAAVSYRKSSSMDLFPAGPSPVTGRIVASRDFDQYPAAGHMIYLNVGEDRGVKPGDYFRIVRGYGRKQMDQADTGLLSASVYEDTQKNPPHLPNSKLKDLPRQVVGEAVVVNTQPGSATAMITFSLQDVHIGDTVELEAGH